MPLKDKEAHKQYCKSQREMYKSHGICIQCGQRPAFHKYVRCEYCLEKMSKYAGASEAKRAYIREWRKKRVEQGLCLNCGKPVYAGSKRFCEICHSRIKAKQRIKKREKYQREIASPERDKHNREAWCKNLEIARKSEKWLAHVEKRKAYINNLMCGLHRARLAKQGAKNE